MIWVFRAFLLTVFGVFYFSFGLEAVFLLFLDYFGRIRSINNFINTLLEYFRIIKL